MCHCYNYGGMMVRDIDRTVDLSNIMSVVYPVIIVRRKKFKVFLYFISELTFCLIMIAEGNLDCDSIILANMGKN